MRHVRGFGRYWGYLLFVLLVTAWWSREVGPGLLIAMSTIVTLYFLFMAPLWCGAVTRNGTLCRNNSSGLLMGCHLREHKWQKIKFLFVPRLWDRLNRGLWASPKEGLATIFVALSILSILVSTASALASA
jgi:hypothetical protein